MASIRKRGAKYHVQIRRKGFPSLSKTFHKKKDAEEWARFMEGKADRGSLPASISSLDRYRVKDIIERYRDEISSKKESHESERCVLNAFMRQPLANFVLSRITSADFSTYRAKRLEKVLPGTVNAEFQMIKHAFDIAMQQWDIPLPTNPLSKLKKLKVNNSRSRRLESGELEALYQAAEKTRNKLIMPLILFAIETGMRRGEMLRVEWSHIDLKGHTLHIPITKNGYARTIPLTRKAMEIMDALKEQDGAGDRPFPITANAVGMAWERLIERSGIIDLHFHDLRHEAISRFFEIGLGVPEVALISGHRDFRMLFRYTNLRAEDIATKLNSK